jgi:HK97 family phage major capsid protein
MTTPIAPLDFSGVIPVQFSTQIIEEAIQQSAALTLANRIPMGTTIQQMPVPKSFPKAGWVAAPGGRKPYTDLKLDVETITAEEIAAVVAIPDVMLDDLSINIWNWVRPRLAEAIGAAVDAAVFFGEDAPATFPVGGIAAVAESVSGGMDVVDTINQAMSAVEVQGLEVTGAAADLGVRGSLRGVRDQSGALLLGTNQVGSDSINTLYGMPVSYVSLPAGAPADFITGSWRNLLIGVRQDIRYLMDPNAVIADSEGKVIISGFQDNVTALKVWARFGCVILKPATLRRPDGANPFAMAELGGITPGGDSGGNGGSGAEPGVAPLSASGSSRGGRRGSGNT